MGIVYRGVPQRITKRLQSKHNLGAFVETGTLMGKSSEWAASHFDRVVTIEIYEKYYKAAKDKLRHYNNVTQMLGDSRQLLGAALEEADQPCLVWLDAHWSRDLREPRPNEGECPIIDELNTILQDKHSHVVLIDDARFFTSPPPVPHRAEDWASLEDIKKALSGWSVKIEDDVIICVPESIL